MNFESSDVCRYSSSFKYATIKKSFNKIKFTKLDGWPEDPIKPSKN